MKNGYGLIWENYDKLKYSDEDNAEYFRKIVAKLNELYVMDTASSSDDADRVWKKQ